MQDAGRTPWVVLGVAEDASFNDVKKAYFGRARTTHPDAPGGDIAAFRAVQGAFEALCRTASSAERSARPSVQTPYDRWLSRTQPSQSWIDADPLLDFTAPTETSAPWKAFADVLATEMRVRNFQAA